MRTEIEPLKDTQFPDESVTIVVKLKGKLFASGTIIHTRKDVDFDKTLINLQNLTDHVKRSLVKLTNRDKLRGGYAAKEDRNKPNEKLT